MVKEEMLACIVGIATVLCSLAILAGGIGASHTAPTYTRRVFAATTYSVMSLLWPILFGCLVGFSSVFQMPLLALSFVWPYALISLNLAHAHRARDDKMHHRSSVQMDVNALSGFCFAIGGLIASQLGKPTAVCTSGIFSTAFLLCLAFVMPTPEVPSDYTFSVVIEALQQCMLHFAIALLLSGIIINLSVSIRMGKRNPNMLRDALATHAPATDAPATDAPAASKE